MGHVVSMIALALLMADQDESQGVTDQGHELHAYK